MADREKVIAGLMMLVDRKNDDTCEGLKCCKIAEDAIALLKKQEAVKRTCRKGIDGFSIIWTCGACGSDLHPQNAKAKYCSNCGREVKWQ